MKYVEEHYANDLHRDLMQRFVDSVPATAISISGGGVHWQCTAKRGGNFCVINCFDFRGPEYLTSFEQDSHKIAWGRTSSKLDTINAVDAWLQRQELPLLYAQFPFVDWTKRALISIRDDVAARFPELAESATNELQHEVCDIYGLWFRGTDRTCRISFYGKNEFPDAAFHWDQCELFRFTADNREGLAAVVKRWVGDRAMPSTMRREFLYLEIGELADYYEHGNPIEGEFIKSWDLIERFYADMRFPFAPQVHNLIAQIRGKGYDKSLRAGQSLWSLIVSRSRRHGLRAGQSSIAFWFGEDGMDVYINFDEEKKVACPKIELTPEIETLLKKLEAQDIG